MTSALASIVEDDEDAPSYTVSLYNQPVNKMAVERNASFDDKSLIVGEFDRDERYRLVEEKVRRFARSISEYLGDRVLLPSTRIVKSAMALIRNSRLYPALPVPDVFPLDGGIFVEWLVADRLRLYFEMTPDSAVYSIEIDGVVVNDAEFPAFSTQCAVDVLTRFSRLVSIETQ